MPRRDRPSGEFVPTGLFSGSEDEIRARLRKKMKDDRDPDSPERREADKQAAFERDDALVERLRVESETTEKNITTEQVMATTSSNERALKLSTRNLEDNSAEFTLLAKHNTKSRALVGDVHKNNVAASIHASIDGLVVQTLLSAFPIPKNRNAILSNAVDNPASKDVIMSLANLCLNGEIYIVNQLREALEAIHGQQAQEMMLEIITKSVEAFPKVKKTMLPAALNGIREIVSEAEVFSPRIIKSLQREILRRIELKDTVFARELAVILSDYFKKYEAEVDEQTASDTRNFLNANAPNTINERGRIDERELIEEASNNLMCLLIDKKYEGALDVVSDDEFKYVIFYSEKLRKVIPRIGEEIVQAADIDGFIFLDALRDAEHARYNTDPGNALDETGIYAKEWNEKIKLKFVERFISKASQIEDTKLLDKLLARLGDARFIGSDISLIVRALLENKAGAIRWLQMLIDDGRGDDVIYIVSCASSKGINDILSACRLTGRGLQFTEKTLNNNGLGIKSYNLKTFMEVKNLTSITARTKVALTVWSLEGILYGDEKTKWISEYLSDEPIDSSALIEYGADLFSHGRFQGAIKLMLDFGATMEDMREAANQRIEYILENITDPNFLLSAEAYEAGYLFDLLYNEDMKYDRVPSHVRRYVEQISRLIQRAANLDFDNETRRAEREGIEPEYSDDRIAHPHNVLVWQYVRAAIVSSADKQVPGDVRILVRNALQEGDAYTFLSMVETANALPGRLDLQRSDAEIEVSFDEIIRSAVFDVQYSTERGHSRGQEPNPRLFAGRQDIHQELLKTPYGAAQLVLLYAEDRFTILDLLQSARNNGITFADIRDTLRNVPYHYATNEQLEEFIKFLAVVNVQVRE